MKLEEKIKSQAGSGVPISELRREHSMSSANFLIDSLSACGV
jgi:hypothetical protein